MTPPDLPHARGDVSENASDGDAASATPGDPFDQEPNYLIRRGIAVGAVVAAIAAGAIFIGGMVDQNDDTTGTGAADSDWNTIVLLDQRSGQVILADENGDEQSRFASGVTNPTDALAVGSTLVVVSADAVSIVEVSDESTQELELDGGSTGVLMPSGSALTVLTATANGDRAVFAHGPSGDVLDTETFAPIAGARYDITSTVATPGGRDLLVTDSGNFQSVLFSFDRDEPSYFPGRSLAIDDLLVVTTQNVGTEANITVFDHDGSSVTDARAPSVRAAMISGDSVILITVDGEILELATPKGTTASVATLDIGTIQTGYVSPSGDRLVVVGEAGSAIVDDSGAVLGTFSDTLPLDVGIDELAPRTSTCVAFKSAADSGLVIASLEDASIVAEATADVPMLPSVDGCTVVASTESGLSVIDPNGLAERGADGDLLALTPDGQGAVTESTSGRLLLTDLTVTPDASVPGTSAPGSPRDETGTIDLGPATRLVLFTRR